MAIIKSHNITLYGGNNDYKIVLRPLSDEHLPLLYKWCSDPEVLYWTEGGTDNTELSYDADTVHQIYGGVSQKAFCFLIEANGVPIGECWLQKMNLPYVKAMHPETADVRRIDMSIGEKDYWNKGIGTVFIRMLVDFAFTGEQVDVLHCFCEDYNHRSRRMWEKNGFLLALTENLPQPQKGKLQYHYTLTRQQYIEKCRVIIPSGKVFMLPIADLQPSQLYISEGKLNLCREWFGGSDVRSMDAIPIKYFMGKNLITDGHTRAVLAYLSGFSSVPCYLDTDELDMATYATDIAMCSAEGVSGIADLAKRIVSPRDYEMLWRKRCMDMYDEPLYSSMSKAVNIIEYLQSLPEVKSCSLYGSLANGKADRYSDIDIEVDVSGSDNGVFMKNLPVVLTEKSPVLWYDFAPSLAREKYVVSAAIDANNPFCIVDFNCKATPHISAVQKSDLENDVYHHLIKLWVTNCKHFIRGADCDRDIRKMGSRTIGSACEKMNNEDILEEVLRRLENNITPETEVYIRNCRKAWDER